MTRKHLSAFLVLAFFFAIALPSDAYARSLNAPPPPENVNYCEGGNYTPERCYTLFEGLTALIGDWITSFAIGTVRILDIILWAFARISLKIFELALNGNLLDVLRDGLLSNVQGFMPQVLSDIALGGNGIMYLALMLAGVLMTIPMAQGFGGRLVRPDRVILWGALLVVLFISGTFGYDLVGSVEQLRQDIMRTMLGSNATENASNLISVPMQAGDADIDISLETLFVLPDDFMHEYFPGIEKWQVTVKTVESGLLGAVSTKLAKGDSKERCIRGAASSVVFALLAMLGGILLLSFSGGFLFLNVAALILILYLFAALPLGFFEFGNFVLTGLIQRYVQIVTYSFGLALLLRVSIEMVKNALPGSMGSLSAGIEWGLLIVIMTIAVRMVSRSTWQALQLSFGSYVQSLRTGLGLPSSSGGVMDSAKRVVGNAALGGIIGGVPGATVGALTALLNRPVSNTGIPPASGFNSTAMTMVSMAGMQGMGDVFVRNGAGQAASPARNETIGRVSAGEYPEPLPSVGVEAPAAFPKAGGSQPPGTTAAARPGFVSEGQVSRGAPNEPEALASDTARQAVEQARIFTPDTPPQTRKAD